MDGMGGMGMGRRRGGGGIPFVLAMCHPHCGCS
jgi:hypothetical protein